MFNGVEYLKQMAAHNKAVQQHKFCVKECAGLAGIEPMMQEFQREANFVIIDNTVDGGLNSNGSGYANRRIFTCSIVMRHKYNDLADRNDKLDICREIYRQFLSRIISDSIRCKYDNSLTYIKPNLVIYKEMDVYTMQGATGITFMLPVDEPVNLCYNDNEWV